MKRPPILIALAALVLAGMTAGPALAEAGARPASEPEMCRLLELAHESSCAELAALEAANGTKRPLAGTTSVDDVTGSIGGGAPYHWGSPLRTTPGTGR